MTLSFDFKVISVILIASCYLQRCGKNMNILGQKKDEFVLQAVRQILTDLSIGDLDL